MASVGTAHSRCADVHAGKNIQAHKIKANLKMKMGQEGLDKDKGFIVNIKVHKRSRHATGFCVHFADVTG